jgi:hypothetical protein
MWQVKMQLHSTVDGTTVELTKGEHADKNRATAQMDRLRELFPAALIWLEE